MAHMLAHLLAHLLAHNLFANSVKLFITLLQFVKTGFGNLDRTARFGGELALKIF